MSPLLPRRITAVVYGVALLFVLAILAAVAGFNWQTRNQAILDSEGQASRFVSSAEGALNRSLLSIDMLLAASSELVRSSTAQTVAANLNQPSTLQRLQAGVRQNMLVRYIAFVTPQGDVIGSSDRRGAQLAVKLPPGHLRWVLDDAAPSFAVSVPSASALTSHRVVYFTRVARLADGTRIVAVAEVQVSLLTTILTQGADIGGLEVTLEQSAGPMLASVPPRDDLSGKVILPVLSEGDGNPHPQRLPARLTAQPAIVVAQPTLHRNLLIVASIPLQAALAKWRSQQALVFGVAALLILMVGVVSFITLLHLRRQWRSRATLNRALASMVDGFVLLDAQDRVLTWNSRFVEMFPWAGDVIGPLVSFQRISDRGVPHIRSGLGALTGPGETEDASRSPPPVPGETELKLENGLVILAVKSRTPDGGMVCIYHDVTEKRQRVADIVSGRAQLQATLDALPDVMLELGLDGMCHGFHSPRTPSAMIEWPNPVGRPVRDVLAPDAASEIMEAVQETYVAGFAKGRQFQRRGGAGITWFEVSVARKSIGEGTEARFIVLLRDITERKSAAREIEHLAFYDDLTGLPNRRLLLHRLKQTLENNARHGRLSALLFLDLDDFKTLNDARGHEIGDQLLKLVSLRLLGVMRDGDTVARFGGDEFVVLLDGLNKDELIAVLETKALAETILAEVQRPFALGDHAYHGTCSIGAVTFDGHAGSLEDLLKQADIAMYSVKSAGGGALGFFESAMQTQITARATLESELHAALANHEFVLFYQRQVTSSGEVVGAEVLIRWQHPHRGLLPPAAFIDLAEDTGLIVPIGLWALEQACLRLDRWALDPRHSPLQLSVNVSARQFRDDNFDEQVRAVLIRTGADPRKLKLELTESLLQHKVPETIRKMKSLAAIGIQFSMDDFGTGFSSLSYMAQLPFHQVKIDKFFVQSIGVNAKAELLIQTIIGMARSLDLQVVAEGVETPAQLAFLKQRGCRLYQGYLFGKPMALGAFEDGLGAPATVLEAL
ncbi:putative bifunctional diguanylate cyclase/phosphodiesterase [Variovorax sp. PAMC 28711]|uniref:putative bifunctional diguanylate cyclase/phosphodiesterase n=1 Tax=Variovorax sp. PAMC 28711 TaxID=1795631 RepID=UPI00078DA10E|nr:EAL domain-containing protein [Variovorax sp. PAMC 28711]AMM23234.1 diguanylate cyclase [Variovorax sp. PAMC 28711]